MRRGERVTQEREEGCWRWREIAWRVLAFLHMAVCLWAGEARADIGGPALSLIIREAAGAQTVEDGGSVYFL